jgi:CheY-like chemotaxis protein
VAAYGGRFGGLLFFSGSFVMLTAIRRASSRVSTLAAGSTQSLTSEFPNAGCALSGEERKARAAGCDDYVPKPYSPRELLAKIRQYLQ